MNNLVPSVSKIGNDVLHTETEPTFNGWDIPDEVALELIDIFFSKIQPILPIMHRPLFYDRFTQLEEQTRRLVSRRESSQDAAFMIEGIFALTARFSKAAIFHNSLVLDRGQVFANKAAAIKDDIIKTIEEPTLDFVKGCTILAFYYVVSGRLTAGSLLTSVCVRFAYDLGLDKVDEDQSLDDRTYGGEEAGYSDAWLRREELRRLWWSIWDLDTFVATLSRQPYAIERGGMKVLLPVSDQQWFSGVPIRSSLLEGEPLNLWRSLQGSPNRNPRAWYLVSNYLMSCIAVAGRKQPRISAVKKLELESALCCLKLALPASFQLRSLYLDDQTSVDGNWIISTHLMIIA
ncbi:uncharacterized protein A1O9_11003 [Exophiala aquamarina CBS 119918]|uniref:Xylanolytic transcriptional activator regulatory domain-containing protein n=1 Tax=Exophiala aquamarina CBS 119918 TaxID=1182545 RepID=A0A072PBX5_9EURO|nr:uncharacterized protein A1O9_11003 [Exophiala aquamarina CBS 119918]KEF53095.1 hypothetical protein A1O9_11003 [Exophiala aquamarina CBS 119918]